MSLDRAGTETAAANLALGHLGQPAIADIADSSLRARTMRRFFAAARDSTMREKWWSFAKAHVRPAADPVDSIGSLATRYVLPADCLRVRYLDDGNGGVSRPMTADGTSKAVSPMWPACRSKVWCWSPTLIAAGRLYAPRRNRAVVGSRLSDGLLVPPRQPVARILGRSIGKGRLARSAGARRNRQGIRDRQQGSVEQARRSAMFIPDIAPRPEALTHAGAQSQRPACHLRGRRGRQGTARA
jgi:hypothetical protein